MPQQFPDFNVLPCQNAELSCKIAQNKLNEKILKLAYSLFSLIFTYLIEKYVSSLFH